MESSVSRSVLETLRLIDPQPRRINESEMEGQSSRRTMKEALGYFNAVYSSKSWTRGSKAFGQIDQR